MDVKKCNITAIALENLNELYWAILKKKDSDLSLVGNYINFLNCPTIKVEECGESKCNNIPIVINCILKANSILITRITDTTILGYQLGFNVGSFTGGTAPFTYLWSYDTTKFDLVGLLTDSTLKLNTKAGIDPALVVSSIHVQIIDVNGCTSSKSCFVTPSGMQCGTAYRNCPTPKSLVVKGKYSICPSPKMLVVH